MPEQIVTQSLLCSQQSRLCHVDWVRFNHLHKCPVFSRRTCSTKWAILSRTLQAGVRSANFWNAL